MKKNKLLLATAILATALGTASLNQNVKAETAGVVTGKTLPITKSMIYTDNDILMPKTTFTFEIAPKVVESADTVDGLKVRAGITEGLVTTTTVAYTNADKSDKKDKTTLFDFSNVKFTEVGVYRYTVSEQDGAVEGIEYDKKQWTVDVYVVNGPNGGFEPKYVVSRDSETNDKKPIIFKNSFDTTSLKVTKKVTGNTGELQKNFTFKLMLKAGECFEAGQIVKLQKSGSTYKIDVTIGKEYQFTLKNGESIQLDKLPVGISYQLEEVEANKDGYTTTATLKEQGKEKSSDFTLSTQNQKTDESADEIVVTNKRDTQVPTGVVGTLAPFAVLSIVAIGGVIYITKRKKA
ncbi:TPA: QVPTGV class sortase B protein-sorting domain-containing protein [Streptococcus pyogenes]|uniref:QVPTGV class sortase B protein-sorting domain-containing protein n=1 Tax=Streptococcus pyogenes TaxID=1314 RepID=UPI000971D377|nr:QVPTGV class sortase B protein-sorting domain-containing protein [Streptococcus pyogenes]HER4653474.1 QVPTGV class sortase B protein-sorting domain-containing protein [Streptococcus pyogenes NGAS500]HER4670461.1 QVPTGV class sortase B protein-sorting domain-containing protein [Streptococcus pyogenes NGAS438]SDV79998.1 Fibronectin-binding protein [Streptococcus pyogenes]SQG18240.1 pilin [Streptococcus pyogenes]HEQ0617654.1 QVPTGV class sortase B protein-sorting domain-containing protein [Str